MRARLREELLGERAGDRRQRAAGRGLPVLQHEGAPAIPRGSKAWIEGHPTQERHAVLRGRFHVSADDVAAVAAPILRHRLIPNFTAQSEGVTPDKMVEKLLAAVPKNQAA